MEHARLTFIKRRLFLFAAIPVILLAADVSAQNITVNNNLAFGAMFPAVPKVISKQDAGAAAEFFVSGTAGSEVSIEFALPTYLGSNGFNMQLIFTETDCAMDSSATPDQSNPGHDDLDPWHPITYRLGSNGLTIWLGGTAVPGVAQKPGDYSASIVVTVTYTGN